MRLKSVFCRVTVIALSVILIGAISGCGALCTYKASSKDYEKKPFENDVTIKEPKDNEFIVETAKRYGLMALFAETVYRRELPETVRDEQGCKYLEPGWKGVVNYGMPKLPGVAEGWERWVPEGVAGKPCVNDKNGLFYETYVYRGSNGSIAEAVIAFRGTEIGNGQTSKDWSSNLSAFFGFEPSQYQTAREHMPALIKSLTDQNAGMRIYAVGHSLGGGLAQQAGYLSQSVLEVFTFNTSPVTNWAQLRFKGLVRQGYPIIHRVYHGGEALETARFIASSATTARYGRHDVGIQFGEREGVSGHSMKLLACSFAGVLSAIKADPGSHNYPTEYMERHVIKRADGNERRVCEDDITNEMLTEAWDKRGQPSSTVARVWADGKGLESDFMTASFSGGRERTYERPLGTLQWREVATAIVATQQKPLLP